jgi:predicted Zn-dependent protease
MSPEEAEAAAAAHPQSAYLAYMTGRILFEAGKVDRAHAHLRRARDLDLLRFRADSRHNGVISAQWERADSRWIPVDTEKALIADSPKGSLGFPHFYEHVHFSQRANFIIARAFARALLTDAGLASERLDTLTWGEAASGLAYTTYEAWLILEQIEQRFGQAPFTSIPGYEQFTAWMDRLREALYVRISSAEEKERSTALYQAAISRRPHDDRLKLGFANFLIAFERPQPAYQLLEGVYARNPTDSEIAVTFLKLAIELNQLDAAAEALARIETLIPGSPKLKTYREDLKKAGR